LWSHYECSLRRARRNVAAADESKIRAFRLIRHEDGAQISPSLYGLTLNRSVSLPVIRKQKTFKFSSCRMTFISRRKREVVFSTFRPPWWSTFARHEEATSSCTLIRAVDFHHCLASTILELGTSSQSQDCAPRFGAWLQIVAGQSPTHWQRFLRTSPWMF
jgi:hypothetical protein